MYADESGIHTSAPYCVVSGYIGSARQWEAFKKIWAGIIGKAEVPAFHSKEFFARGGQPRSRIGPYAGWSDDQAGQFLDSLMGAINQHRLHPIGGAVDVAAFNDLTYGERRFLTGGGFRRDGRFLTSGAPSKPYYLAFQRVVVDATNQAKDRTVVNFTFDRQNVLQSGAADTFQRLKETFDEERADKLGLISFDASPRNPGLQAADLHTHAWYSYLSRRERMSVERRHAMDTLTRKRDTIQLFDRALLEKLLSGLDPGERASMRRQRKSS